MSKNNLPTNAELAILNILWETGKSTVKEIHEKLDSGKGYTTTLKFVQIMREKKMVERLSDSRPHQYRALAEQAKTEKSLITTWVDKLMGGSAASLAMKALGNGSVSNDELNELRTLLNEIEDKNNSNQ